MGPARGLGLTLGRICLALLLIAGPAASQPVTVEPAEARQIAARAVIAGQPAYGLDIARALLVADPNDVAAATTASRAARALGRYAEAQAYARQAWEAAGDDKERYHASVAMAQALASDDKRTRAQFWLRRAAEYAPSDAARTAAQRDFTYVRGRNPWRSKLSLSLTPSSNINNGAATDRIEIGGLGFQLSGDAQALSGTQLSLGASTEYRIRSGPRTILRFGGGIEAKRYWLSGEAKEQAPMADAADYAYTSAELTFGLTRAPKKRPQGAKGPAFGLFDAEVAIGKSWYGGEPLLTFARARLGQSFRLAPRTSGWVAVLGEWQDRIDNPLNSLTSSELQLGLSRRFETGQLTVIASAKEVDSDSALTAHSSQKLFAAYRLAKPVFTAETTLSASYEYRDYEAALFSTDRRDNRAKLGLTFFFSEADYYGFAPEVGVSFEQNNSSVDLYSTETLGITFGLKSTF
ncbi:surface lipoprotein assembly modifier [Vannielia sp. SX4]|uniref:surface lipoprotein assembly modifier n=1 Tax=Vannielia sp. SX4 TaxID=3463852 RepID=UPI004059C044